MRRNSFLNITLIFSSSISTFLMVTNDMLTFLGFQVTHLNKHPWLQRFLRQYENVCKACVRWEGKKALLPLLFETLLKIGTTFGDHA